MRSGIIGKKVGMTVIYQDSGLRIPVTLIQIMKSEVIQLKKQEKDGYNAVVIGLDAIKDKNISSPMKGVFKSLNVSNKSKIKEFRVVEDSLLECGYKFDASYFSPGQYLDVCGVTKGKGFAGVMKRHNFRGLEASHGVSVSHRSHGSTGQRQDPGKVFKNKKMAGHMGCVKVTQQNLLLVDIDQENQMLIVRGSVPGNAGSYLFLYDAVKKYN